MFDAVFNVLGHVENLIKETVQRGDMKREKLAVFCEQTADILRDYIAASGDRRKSISLCGKLELQAMDLEQLPQGALASTDLMDKLVAALKGVCVEWRKMHAAGEAGMHSDERDLDLVVAAEGKFRGAANRIRAV